MIKYLNYYEMSKSEQKATTAKAKELYHKLNLVAYKLHFIKAALLFFKYKIVLPLATNADGGVENKVYDLDKVTIEDIIQLKTVVYYLGTEVEVWETSNLIQVQVSKRTHSFSN